MPQKQITRPEIARHIDHTLLRPDATASDIERLCAEAVEYSFKAVCVNSCQVALAARLLKGSEVAVCSVVGFPLGAMQSSAKAFEARQARADGAGEIDMVINLGLLKSGQYEAAQADIAAVRGACKGALLKVIIETCLLSDEQKVRACKLAQAARADFVKTSTGFAGGGATMEDVALMRRSVGPHMGVKASGGVSSWEQAVAMIRAGATRIGASAGIKILAGRSRSGAR